jgi:tetratricopeptide (TPR) repeat protein
VTAVIAYDEGMRRIVLVAAAICVFTVTTARADEYDAALALDRARVQSQSPRDREIAQFDLAISLHELGLKQAAYVELARIARSPSHARHREALPWLAVLALELGEAADVEESVGRYGEPAIDAVADDATRWTLDYLLARYAYRNHHYDDALRLFAKVDRRSHFYARAQIQSGFAHVAMRRTTPALQSFDRAAR